MIDPVVSASIAGAAVVAVVTVAVVALKAWRDWIALQRLALENRGGSGGGGDRQPISPTARIELADLKERVRKLEAIAAGVDL